MPAGPARFCASGGKGRHHARRLRRGAGTAIVIGPAGSGTDARRSPWDRGSAVRAAIGAGRGGATGARALTPAGDGVAEEVFDLPVDAAEFVGRPGFQLAPELGIDPQKE